ncbi:MAG: type II secretion system F family protein [Eubacteriales bacterium]
MAAYTYVITDSNGKRVKGTMNCDNRADAVEQLKANGSTVLSIEDAIMGGVGSRGNDKGGGGRQPKPKELAVFCRQFVSISEAGVPVVSTLDMLIDQTENKQLAYGLAECKRMILEGETFSEAMAQFPKTFPKMLVTLAAAGEASGSLENSFLRMAIQFEKEARLASTIKKAGVYPCVIFVVMIAVVIVMLVFVVPQFEMMFNDMGTTLPGITLFVLGVSEYLQDKWYMVMAYMIGGFLLMVKFLKSPLGESTMSIVTLKIPVVNNLVSKTACARMARTLSTLQGAGLDLIPSIETTANTMTNLVFRAAVYTVADEVALGNQMSDTMKETGVFPALMYHMVSIGEETGKTDKMLDTLAGYYEEEVEAATEAVMALLEPATIIVMAVLVGGIIGSVMAPMAKMYEELGNL